MDNGNTVATLVADSDICGPDTLRDYAKRTLQDKINDLTDRYRITPEQGIRDIIVKQIRLCEIALKRIKVKGDRFTQCDDCGETITPLRFQSTDFVATRCTECQNQVDQPRCKQKVRYRRVSRSDIPLPKDVRTETQIFAATNRPPLCNLASIKTPHLVI